MSSPSVTVSRAKSGTCSRCPAPATGRIAVVAPAHIRVHAQRVLFRGDVCRACAPAVERDAFAPHASAGPLLTVETLRSLIVRRLGGMTIEAAVKGGTLRGADRDRIADAVLEVLGLKEED